MLKFKILTLVLIIFSACSPYKVINIRDVADIQTNAFVYALPRTAISIDINCEKVTLIPGPYNAYAQSFLQIDNAASTKYSYWKINSINLETVAKPDPENYYMIKSWFPWGNINSLQMETNGILKAINFDAQENELTNNSAVFESEEMPEFTDLTTQKAYKNKFEKVKGIDTTFQHAPSMKAELVMKTTTEKAKEAANFILKIRKRRFKLISGMYEKFYDQQALQIAITELDKLEAEYLSLFIGKEIIEERNFNYEYFPQAGGEDIKIAICQFSEEKGCLSSLEVEGKTIYLEISQGNNTSSLQKYISNQETLTALAKKKPAKNGLYYRIPEEATIKIQYNNEIICVLQDEISQFGVILSLPKKILYSRKRTIIFNSKTGSLHTTVKK